MADQSTIKDIKMIYSVHSRMDYSNLEEVRTVQEKLIARNAFESDIGIDYLDKLSDIVKKSDMGRCIFCHQMFASGTAICEACLSKLDMKYGSRRAAKATEAVQDPAPVVGSVPMPEAVPETVSEPEPASFMESMAAMAQEKISTAREQLSSVDTTDLAADVGRKVKKAADKSVKNFARKVDELAGGDGIVELRFKDLFSDVLKKHSAQEMEEIFICGTSLTTPDESRISAEWPKPWLYSRVLVILFAAFYLLILCWTGFHNTNVIPDIIFIGSCIMPITVLIFLFEINAPRNISLITVLKVFFVGGSASLVVTLILFTLFPTGELNYIGALLVGIIEEAGKAVIVAIAIARTKKCKYIFNGLLIGGAVGAGFAVFESAGYAFNIYLRSFGYENAYSNMIRNVYLRGILSPGGHVAWAAITGAGIMIALAGKEFSKEFVSDKRFIALFLMSVIMHAIWDCPFQVLGIPLVKLAILIAAAWIVLVVLINNGLREVNSLKAK